MKKQIKRLSPHQNGKVFGILIAIATLPFLIPMMIMFSFTGAEFDQTNNSGTFPGLFLLIAPLMYLVFGYISVAIACLLYNFIQRFTGGFEFEVTELPAE